jgi:hypothetical protein
MDLLKHLPNLDSVSDVRDLLEVISQHLKDNDVIHEDHIITLISEEAGQLLGKAGMSY